MSSSSIASESSCFVAYVVDIVLLRPSKSIDHVLPVTSLHSSSAADKGADCSFQELGYPSTATT